MTLEEYMEELYLMDKQYGQEEELYPLINILLRQSGSVAGLSLRDVHNASKAESIKHRELLKGPSGFPDLVILDKEFGEDGGNPSNDNNQYVYGCLEAKINDDFKPMDDEYLNKNLTVKTKTKILIRYDDQYKNPYYIIVDNDFSEIKINNDYYCIYMDGDKNEKIYNNQKEIFNDNHIDTIKLDEFDISSVKHIYYTKVDPYGITKETTVKELVNNIRDNLSSDDIIIFKKLTIICCQDEETTINTQLFGQIVFFGNVIYTDGKTWHLYKRECYNEVEGGHNIKISHEVIGDLSEIFDSYKEYKKEIREIDKYVDCHVYKFTPAAYKKWKELLKNLAKIEWEPEIEETKE
ncbi:MAG: hypothetical protein E7271_07145 [Lachnospiraceae bacterium]|nr:hypothetical protein [Lachnospiraceae bacterium]